MRAAAACAPPQKKSSMTGVCVARFSPPSWRLAGRACGVCRPRRERDGVPWPRRAARAYLSLRVSCSGRAAEAAYVEERDAAMIADSWESVCKLVDLKGPEKPIEKDTSRMRGLLVQLKHV